MAGTGDMLSDLKESCNTGKECERKENLGMHRRHLRDESFDPDTIVYKTCFDTSLDAETDYLTRSNQRKGDFGLSYFGWWRRYGNKDGRQLIDSLCLPEAESIECQCPSHFPLYFVLDSSLRYGETHNQGGSPHLHLVNLDHPSQIYPETNLI